MRSKDLCRRTSDERYQGIPIQRGPPLWSRALDRTSPRTVGAAGGKETCPVPRILNI